MRAWARQTRVREQTCHNIADAVTLKTNICQSHDYVQQIDGIDDWWWCQQFKYVLIPISSIDTFPPNVVLYVHCNYTKFLSVEFLQYNYIWFTAELQLLKIIQIENIKYLLTPI